MAITRTTLVLTGAFLLTVSAFGYFLLTSPAPAGSKQTSTISLSNNEVDSDVRQSVNIERLAGIGKQAKQFTADNQYNNDRCFLLDMRLPSGKNRFFVYNMQRDSIELAGLVTHGSGSDKGTDHLSFSNTPNSHCTSLGKYRISNAYNGVFGLAYKLIGLDNTNSKAYDRFIVLHGHDCVPDSEVFPYPICHSLGCPTVSPAFLTRLSTLIDNSAKPILLWIFY